MFLKTLKHFIILKLKELLTALKWVGIVVGGLGVLLAPGQIVLRNPDYFTFLGELAKIDPQHHVMQLWLGGTVLSILFWLVALLLFLCALGVISYIKDTARYGFSFVDQFKQWCRLRRKELIATLIFSLGGFVGVWVLGGFTICAPYTFSGKIAFIVFSSILFGAILFAVSCAGVGIIAGVCNFFRNNWRDAKVLAEKECPDKYAN